MLQIDLISVLPSLVGSLVGGGIFFFIARSVTRHSHTYANLDTLYSKILDLYLEFPKFLELSNTKIYKSAFTAEELQKYEAFSMRVFTFLETVYDTRYHWRSGDIECQWRHLFEKEFVLHEAWYKDNKRDVSDYFREFLDRKAVQIPRT